MKLKKTQEEKVKKLCSLLRKEYLSIEKSSCYGKWAGTYDYSIRFTDGTRYFISNGWNSFESILDKTIEGIDYALSNKEHIIKKLSEMAERDNKVSKEKGLSPYQIKDIAIVTSDLYMGWAVLILDVNGTEVVLKETGLSYALKSEEWLEKEVSNCFGRDYFIAAGVKEPLFVFGNVGHDGESYSVAPGTTLVA